jgi:hypothetical protein
MLKVPFAYEKLPGVDCKRKSQACLIVYMQQHYDSLSLIICGLLALREPTNCNDLNMDSAIP